MGDRLFPEYLNAGSRGPAVVALQLFLLGGYNAAITPSGDYDEHTVTGVKALQSELGLDGVGDGVDGHFGPGTRAELKRQYGFDIDALPADIFVGETVAVFPEGVSG